MEVFKDIIGYNGLYQISNTGKVKSLPKGNGNGNRERLLKFDCTADYARITFSKDGITIRKNVHKLVAEYFLLNPQNKPQVNHKDLNKLNNHVSNLEWVTSSENAQHAYNNGACDNAINQARITNNERRIQSNTDIFSRKLGNRFIELVYKNYKTSVRFKCRYCGNITLHRTDGNRLKYAGRCKEYKCFKQEKIEYE